MIDPKDQTLYDVLDIGPDANPQEIRAAYHRAKAAYRKDSVALYSLMDPEETDRILARIEEAFAVLSSPERRKEYDRKHGQISETFSEPEAKKIFSIDRVPPMEGGSGDDLLVAPATDFTAPAQTQRPAQPPAAARPPADLDDLDPFGNPMQPAKKPVPAAPQPGLTKAPVTPNVAMPTGPGPEDPTLALEITEQVEWRGRFLRKVRESKRVSVEEMADYSKISKTYILAIEDENYDKLPAVVYLRGFILQICRYLKLPGEKAAAAYLARVTQWRTEKEKRG
ncbi:MAG: helix-turn-helix domain-containing protein [Bdellovibrionales bacterium]|nr:helix-turn-helix domain-containing protein [Bdellovibrionales bacterium]